MIADPAQVTALLNSWRLGNAQALEDLLPLVQAELRKVAGRAMAGEYKNSTLQPTALVNETFLRLLGNPPEGNWVDRVHFLGICARLMRQVLVDVGRRKAAIRRGGEFLLLPLGNVDVGGADPAFELIALNESLDRLAEIDKRKVEVFELRFFGGLDVKEVAGELGISVPSVVRDWKFVCAWLRKELSFRTRVKGA